MTEARELLDGVRRMAIEMETLTRCREELFASVAGAKSPKTRDPGMSVQFSRDTSDHMADVAAEIADLDREIEQTKKILEADRKRIRAMLLKIKSRDEQRIARLYYLSPFKIVFAEPRGKNRKRVARRVERTWGDVEELLGLTHDPVMKRRRKLIEKMDKLITKGM